MEFLSKGGYAEVFYDKNTQEIFRRLPRRNRETKCMEISTFSDLIYTRSFEYTGCTPIIHSEDISKDYVSFRMPYYGVSLHAWVHQQSLAIRKKYAAYILLQVVTACIYFEKNAFLHCDMKPLNIVLETVYKKPESASTSASTTAASVSVPAPQKDTPRPIPRPASCPAVMMQKHTKKPKISKAAIAPIVPIAPTAPTAPPRQKKAEEAEEEIEDIIVRVIDFNCASVKMIDHKNQNREWTYAIGTWNYMPPEIILHEMPTNQSMSWCIGILAAYILDTYPFAELIANETAKALTEQEVWKRMIREWCIKNPEHIPLARVKNYGAKWDELIFHCTHWKSADRWSLSTIYHFIYDELMDHENLYCMTQLIRPSFLTDIVSIQYPIDCTRVSSEERSTIIDTMYRICETISHMNLFSTAVAVFDRACLVVEWEMLTKVSQLGIGAFLLTSFAYNSSVVTSRTYLPKILNGFGCISRSHALAAACYVGQCLRWELWEKPAHIMVAEIDETCRWNMNIYQYIKEALIHQKNEYTQKQIAEEVVEKIHAAHAALTLPTPFTSSHTISHHIGSTN